MPKVLLKSLLSAVSAVAVAGVVGLNAGCEAGKSAVGSAGSWLETGIGLIGLGDDKTDTFQSALDDVSDAQNDAQVQTELAYAELVKLSETPSAELNAQYAKAVAAVGELENKSNAMVAQLSEFQGQADAYIDELMADLKDDVNNPALQRMAQDALDQVKVQYAAAFQELNKLTVDLSPAVQAMNTQVSQLQGSLNDAGITQLRSNLDQVKGEVDAVAVTADESEASVNSLSTQLSVLDQLLTQLAMSSN